MSDVLRVRIPGDDLMEYEPVSEREVALMELAMRYAVQADRANLARLLPMHVQQALERALNRKRD